MGEKILAIDDNPQSIEILRLCLEMHGYKEIMAQRAEIMKQSVGIDYSQYETGALAKQLRLDSSDARLRFTTL